MRSLVICSTSFEGFHAWPDAPEPVDFLQYPHRHIFHVKLAKEVKHNDRDIEFILLKRAVDSYIKVTWPLETSLADVTSRSCEMMAKQLLEDFGAEWVEVWEDNENGARVEI